MNTIHSSTGRLTRRRLLRIVTLGASLSAVSPLLVACATSTAPSPSAATPKEQAPSAPTKAASTSSAPAQQTPAAAAAAKGAITFFARGDDAIFKVFRDLRDTFQQSHPDIQVTIDEVPGDWYQKFQLQLASGTPPDAIFESAGTTTASARAGALHPLDDLMKSDSRFNKSDYWDIAFLPSLWEGKTYHLPYDGGSMAIYYNQDLFKAAGVNNLDPKEPPTFDQLLELAKQLTLDQDNRHPGEAGFDPTRVKQYGFNPSSVYWVYAFATGGEIINTDGTVPLDSPEAAEGLQWRADLGAKHFVAPSPEYQQSSPISFNTGNVAIQYDGVWASVRYRQNEFNWDIAPFPKGKVKVSTGWYSGLSITAASQLKEAAWEWSFFCCSEPGQKIVSGLGQAVPGVTSLAETEVFLDGAKTPPANDQTFLDEMDANLLRLPGDKFGSPFGGYWREFGQILNPIYDAVWSGTKTAAEAGKEVRPKLEHLLKTGEVT